MLSYRIARFMDDYDPYGFMDALETGRASTTASRGPRGKPTP